MARSDENAEKLPDRPLECSECKKPITIRYTEIIGDNIIHTSHCSDCPELQKKLQGVAAVQANHFGGGGLACGECGTTLQALKVGNPLGCSNCYEVFGDIIFSELVNSEKIPPRLFSQKKSDPLHLGRSPGEIQEMNPSMRLLALNEALNETLKREDYEQAAWLRDQIKALTDEPPPSEKKP